MCESRGLPLGWRALLWGLVCLLGSGCASPTPAPAQPSPTTPPTASPTPTVIWFPPTATPTAHPTAPLPSPTPPRNLPHGALILQDFFGGQHTDWLLTPAPNGRITIGGNEMTFTSQGAKAYLYSLRTQPLLRDFSLQVEVSLNLCQGLDEYGVLLRFTPPSNYYRFSVACQGQTRLDRLYNGTATSPQPWTVTGNAPRGAPGSVLLAVQAQGKTLRFFINGVEQFSVTDPFPAAGQIGLFVRSSSESPLSISFQTLQLWESAPAE